ncbi:MAG TPA: adenylyltransferase/cytidyltransferase family protein [candidate division Zixibacteria bacterium]|nr:adenylyltransferase/cytidyltransferase family protein [candidate division Zixibacteria bacterium]
MEKFNRSRVLVFGTFDIIHPSHIKFLTEARKAAGCEECELVVVVARDSSILRIKGRKPIFQEEQRLKLICGLRVVDYARLGNEGKDYFNVILEVNPDYIVLGYDQVHNEKPLCKFISENNLQVEVFNLPKFESGDLSSSSEVRERVLEMINEKNKE